MGYSYKKLQGPDNVQLQDLPQSSSPDTSPDTAREEPPLPQNSFHPNPKTISLAVKMLVACLVLLSALSLTRAAILEKKQAASTASASTTRVPQVFQTTPEIFTGMLKPSSQDDDQVANWQQVQLQLALRLSWPRSTPLPSVQPRSLQTAPLRPRYRSLVILRMRVSSS